MSWYEDHATLIQFAWDHFEPLGDSTAQEVIEFFEKPWKWTPEYETWAAEADDAPEPSGRYSDDYVRDHRIDVEMIQRPQMWPMVDRLPMKRRGAGKPRTGMLWEGQGPKVFLHGGLPIDPTTEIRSYSSFQAMVDDGWVVD